MPILSFISNTQVNLITGGQSVGDGPVRLVQFDDKYQVVIVDDSTVIATSLQFPANMNDTDRAIPLSMIRGAPEP